MLFIYKRIRQENRKQHGRYFNFYPQKTVVRNLEHNWCRFRFLSSSCWRIGAQQLPGPEIPCRAGQAKKCARIRPIRAQTCRRVISCCQVLGMAKKEAWLVKLHLSDICILVSTAGLAYPGHTEYHRGNEAGQQTELF